MQEKKHVWYVALIGRPNVGKSTFLNTLLWEKVSITSPIPQTTRRRVLGIYNTSDAQIIFFDTPGIHESKKEFNQKINSEAIRSLKDADYVVYCIDSSRPDGIEDQEILTLLQEKNIDFLTLYTKIDLPSKREIPKNALQISSKNQEGFEEVVQHITTKLPISHLWYPEEYYTDQDMYFRISEIVREKVFLSTIQEIPHSVFVEIEEIEDKPEILRIQAYIYTETDSQKYILIGKWGSLLTKIGTLARQDLENIFEKKVFLASSKSHSQVEKIRENDKKNTWRIIILPKIHMEVLHWYF